MKKFLIFLATALVGGVIGATVVTKQLRKRHSAELAAQQSLWLEEKADLETAIEKARASARQAAVPIVPSQPVEAQAAITNQTPAEIVAKLRAMKFAQTGQNRAARQIIHHLEELIAAGPRAVPAIRDFLALREDIDFAGADGGKGGRGGVPSDFVLPPSLRFGLFDALKQIGGGEAEAVLGEVLSTTGRGAELAWLARTLEEIAPNKYRDTALTAARDLLGRSLLANSTNALDRNDRDHLFSVLAMYGDSTYVASAQTQLIQADGGVDRSALKYLQQTLGQQAVAIAAQAYNDPRVTDPAKKEPLARLALNFVGVDPQANEFYQKAINDLNLPNDHRKNLIEDLNQDGFADRKNINQRDLQLIQNRIALIEQLAPSATDPVNAAAFKEAYKDLQKMLASAGGK